MYHYTIKIISTFILSLILFTVYAKDEARPTITFNGETYYLAKAFFDEDITNTPVDVAEWYVPVGQTLDNYTKSIRRITYLDVSDYHGSASSLLSDMRSENPSIPSERKDGSHKSIVKVAFWWPFRPSIVAKEVYVFQGDKSGHVLCYIVTELAFFPSNTSNADLRAKGKALLIDEKTTKAAEELSF